MILFLTPARCSPSRSHLLLPLVQLGVASRMDDLSDLGCKIFSPAVSFYRAKSMCPMNLVPQVGDVYTLWTYRPSSPSCIRFKSRCLEF